MRGRLGWCYAQLVARAMKRAAHWRRQSARDAESRASARATWELRAAQLGVRDLQSWWVREPRVYMRTGALYTRAQCSLTCSSALIAAMGSSASQIRGRASATSDTDRCRSSGSRPAAAAARHAARGGGGSGGLGRAGRQGEGRSTRLASRIRTTRRRTQASDRPAPQRPAALPPSAGALHTSMSAPCRPPGAASAAAAAFLRPAPSDKQRSDRLRRRLPRGAAAPFTWRGGRKRADGENFIPPHARLPGDERQVSGRLRRVCGWRGRHAWGRAEGLGRGTGVGAARRAQCRASGRRQWSVRACVAWHLA